MIPKTLTIAGSDSSGGAGIQADLKTFSALGCYGMSVVTAVTAQNTRGVQSVFMLPEKLISQQINSVGNDVEIHAVKIGMLPNAEIISAVSKLLKKMRPPNVVVDPVMVATSGDLLMQRDAVSAMKKELLPLADLITPNYHEASILESGGDRDIKNPEKTAKLLKDLYGCKAVLIKGGHGKGEVCSDVYVDENNVEVFEAPRLKTDNTHGTGCTLSAAIAANLAKGHSMLDAIGEAKNYINGAIGHADALDVGRGHGPVHHFWNLWDNKV